MIPLFPVCPGCDRQFDGSRPLSKVPCRVLRRPMAGEVVSWPPETAQDEDEDLRILRDMGLVGNPEDDAQQVYIAPSDLEPVSATLSTGETIAWRYLRLSDLIMAEDFASRSQHPTLAPGQAATSPGAKLNAFIFARYIQSINGQRVGVLEAMQWAKRAPMPVLGELRAYIERRAFGYELSPSFRCPSGHAFRQQLPLNAAMFRDSKRPAFR